MASQTRAAAKQTPQKTHQALGLHIGLNALNAAAYAGWTGPLAACEFDAHDMAAIAQHSGMQSTLLLTKKATQAKVLAVIRRAAIAVPGSSARRPQIVPPVLGLRVGTAHEALPDKLQTAVLKRAGSAFTEQLLRVWNQGRNSGSDASFHAHRRAQLPPTPSPKLFTSGAAAGLLKPQAFSV